MTHVDLIEKFLRFAFPHAPLLSCIIEGRPDQIHRYNPFERSRNQA